MVVVLLLFAATDLSFPGGCGDTPKSVHAGTALSADGESPAGHQGDDCFCCSRTVRTTAVVTVITSVHEMPAPVAVLPEPRSIIASRLYHPPII
jgi:hypothetical protein